MTDREKLVELLSQRCDLMCFGCEDRLAFAEECKEKRFGKVADHLIANGVTVQRWIPVTERLPDNGENVLCRYKDEQNKEWETVGVILGDEWELDIDGLGDRCLTVTHWMPIPPKEE